MYAINCTGTRDSLRIKVVAFEIRGHLSICCRQTFASLLGGLKLRCDISSRSANLWGGDDQNRRHRHTWLDWRCPNLIHKCSYSLGCRPSVVVWVAELKIVRTEH